MQAHADPWLGFTELNGVGQLVAEVSPYAADLDWADVNEPENWRACSPTWAGGGPDALGRRRRVQ
ncbi:DUF2252 family protein, partial [Micromonospora sp. b486]